MEAGIKIGDVVLEIDDTEVNTTQELQEIIVRHRPRDKVNLEIARRKKELDLNVELKNREREAKYLAKNREEIFNVLGAEF
ncbi:MAG: PDZ domain-containing protein [Algoriphagus sp.]|uniref:PDZ domain-containing protein n=1 Tax=Algoriphagus sp. TaxID=1872435 RepID=UPI00261D3266|nr:PDZ domain-containing protein [Algoriphagus sp.]MDG1276826.1 PDZ domain-containing protein [Algoriphagus sp.]